VIERTGEPGEQEWLEFRPRPSSGRLWTSLAGGLLFLLFLSATILAWEQFSPVVRTLFISLGVVAAIPLLLLAWYFPTMRYRLGPKELTLTFGPLLHDRIPLDAIKSIRRRNLRVAQLTAFRFPGLALFFVDYLGLNRVRMCATSSTTRILIIDIGHRRYGITPQDEFELVQAILRRSSADIRVSENFNPDRQPETTISP
jgi:hypothetical protein